MILNSYSSIISFHSFLDGTDFPYHNKLSEGKGAYHYLFARIIYFKF